MDIDEQLRRTSGKDVLVKVEPFKFRIYRKHSFEFSSSDQRLRDMVKELKDFRVQSKYAGSSVVENDTFYQSLNEVNNSHTTGYENNIFNYIAGKTRIHDIVDHSASEISIGHLNGDFALEAIVVSKLFTCIAIYGAPDSIIIYYIDENNAVNSTVVLKSYLIRQFP